MSGKSLRFENKSILFREGDECTKLMIVKSGQVLCLKSYKDRLIPVFIAQEQNVVGESAICEGIPYTYSAIALGPVEVIVVSSTDFAEVLKTAPQWLVDLSLTMVSRFQSTAGLIAENRVFHHSILSDEKFPPNLENEIKKLLNQ